MSKESKIKLLACATIFVIVFLLLYPKGTGCHGINCFEESFLFSIILGLTTVNKIDFLFGNAFYGAYFYTGKIPSIIQDDSTQNVRIRRFYFGSLILIDAIVIWVIIRHSWLFN